MNSGHALLQFEKQNLRALNAGAPAKNMQHPENVKVTWSHNEHWHNTINNSFLAWKRGCDVAACSVIAWPVLHSINNYSNSTQYQNSQHRIHSTSTFSISIVHIHNTTASALTAAAFALILPACSTNTLSQGTQSICKHSNSIYTPIKHHCQ